MCRFFSTVGEIDARSSTDGVPHSAVTYPDLLVDITEDEVRDQLSTRFVRLAVLMIFIRSCLSMVVFRLSGRSLLRIYQGV